MIGIIVALFMGTGIIQVWLMEDYYNTSVVDGCLVLSGVVDGDCYCIIIAWLMEIYIILVDGGVV